MNTAFGLKNHHWLRIAVIITLTVQRLLKIGKKNV